MFDGASGAVVSCTNTLTELEVLPATLVEPVY